MLFNFLLLFLRSEKNIYMNNATKAVSNGFCKTDNLPTKAGLFEK